MWKQARIYKNDFQLQRNIGNKIFTCTYLEKSQNLTLFIGKVSNIVHGPIVFFRQLQASQQVQSLDLTVITISIQPCRKMVEVTSIPPNMLNQSIQKYLSGSKSVMTINLCTRQYTFKFGKIISLIYNMYLPFKFFIFTFDIKNILNQLFTKKKKKGVGWGKIHYFCSPIYSSYPPWHELILAKINMTSLTRHL